MVAVVPVTFDGHRRTANYRDHGGKRQYGWKQIFPLIGKTGYHQHGEQNSHNQSETSLQRREIIVMGYAPLNLF